MMASVDDTEPPGTEMEESDTQPLSQDDMTEGSFPGSQEMDSVENDSADQNSSFEKRSSGEHRSRRSHSHRERSSRHSRSRRKHSRRSKRSREEVVYDDESLYSARTELETNETVTYGDKETEDGEILEDGEIASDDGEDFPQGVNVRRSLDDVEGRSEDDHSNGDMMDEPADSNDIEDKGARESRSRREKRKRREKRRDKEDKRKKARRHDYVDHDRVEENEGGRWSHYQGGPDDDYFQGKRDPRDMYYYNSGDSLPGLYDSPSEESDDDLPSQPSLTSLVPGDFLDANVAANEKEHLKMKNLKSARERKKSNRGKRKGDGGRQCEPPKKKLVEIPMAERPVCKFYKDGKCAKGSNCPFNHDAVRNKRLECCKFHLMQTGCIKGENCMYMHDFPCKYYHTGQTCYAGAKCRFSHDPLTDETRKIIEEMINPTVKEEEAQDRPKKPSLLGSPPRHVKAAMERAKEIKKIPSLFDIEVFPPGQKPPKPVSFYSERGDSSSPPPDGSPTRPVQSQGPMSSSPSPSLLGTPPKTSVRGPNPGNMMQQGPMMMSGSQGPMNRPMMGPQRPVFGMQQGINPGMQQGMNPGMQQGMNSNMQQGMNANMNQNMNPGMMQQGMGPRMQQGMAMNQGMNTSMENSMNPGLNQNVQNVNQNMQQGMQQVTNQGMQQGMNQGMQQGMNQGMQQGMNQGMQQGMNQNTQQGMNQNMQQGMNQGMQQGVNQGMQQGVNQGMQQNMNQNMQQCMNQGMQQRMQNPGMQQGMNPNMLQQGMNPNMQQGMNMNQGMNPMQGMMNQQGMNPNMRGLNPSMMQGMNRMMNPNMPGMAAARFGMGTQTASSMPPVFNMISALLRGTSGNGPFNQNGPQGPVPNQGPMGPQDADIHSAGDTDLRKGVDKAETQVSEKDSVPGNTQDAPAEHNTAKSGHDSGAVSSSPINQDVNEGHAAGGSADDRNRGLSPQYGQTVGNDEEVLQQDRMPSGEDSSEEALTIQETPEASKSPSDQQLSPGNKGKSETDSDSGVTNTADKDDSFDIAMQLPPMQRQLFMRIRQQQQQQSQQQQQKEEAMESEESHSAEDNKPAEKETVEDDDWYSSDEDEDGLSKKKLTDILKTVSKAAVTSAAGGVTATATPASAFTSSSASTINVMQMIQSIRSQAQTSQPDSSITQSSGVSTSAPSGTRTSKDPRQRQTDPRSASGGSNFASESQAPTTLSMALPVLPTLFVDPPVTDGVPKKTVVYRMTPLSVRAVKPYWSLPPSVDIDDEEQKKDPRVQAHIALVEKRGPEPKGPTPQTKVSDPRLSRKSSAVPEEAVSSSPRPVDPRMRRTGGKDPRLGPQDPRSQNMVPPDPRAHQNTGPQDPRGQNQSRQDPRMQNVPGQEPWMGNNMGSGGIMGPDARMMNPGAGGMNMMHGPSNMGPNFHGNMMQGSRGMMPGQGEVWNGPMRMGAPVNMQQGPMSMQQGLMGMQQNQMGMQQNQMGMQQSHMNMHGGPMGMNQGPMNNMQGGMMNMQGGLMGMQDPRRGPMNMQGGPMGMQQGNMGMQQGNMGMQQGNMGMQGGMVSMQQGNMGMQQGNMGMQQGNANMQQGNVGMQQGNTSMQQGNMGMQQGNTSMQQGNMGMQQGNMAMQQGSQMESNQGRMGSSDPRQNIVQRGHSDPRQRGQSSRGDPREGRSSAVDPRMSRISQDSPQNSPPGPSSQFSDSKVSLSHQLVPEDSSVSHINPTDSTGSLRHNNPVSKDSQSGMGSFSVPSALRELPSRLEPDPGASEDGSTSEEGASVKKHFDYRNDPRFKRKRASENKSENTHTSDENSEERNRKFMGQRKSSMEYASPLGGSEDVGSSGSGYNSYNRPSQSRQDPRKKKTVSPVEKPFELPRMELPPLLSSKPPPLPENMASSEMLQGEPEPQLKDLFKTFDPTASPFC